MSYRYQIHLHTSLSSECGRAKGSEYARFYKEHGYDGIFITDHFYLGNTCVPRSLPWEEWVHRYCDAWREAKETGDQIGLKVFFGWETSYAAEDFLIYGLGEDWLLAHPEIIRWNQAEQYAAIHAAGGLVVQAHPFRERWYQSEIKLHPWHCDVMETANDGNRPYMDALAFSYAREHGIPMIAGADLHKMEKAVSSLDYALETEEAVESEADFARRILSGRGFTFHAPEGRFTAEHRNAYFSVYEYDRENGRHEIVYHPWPDAPTADQPLHP